MTPHPTALAVMSKDYFNSQDWVCLSLVYTDIPPGPAAWFGSLLASGTWHLGFLSWSGTSSIKSAKCFPQNFWFTVWQWVVTAQDAKPHGRRTTSASKLHTLWRFVKQSRDRMMLSTRSPGYSCRNTGFSSKHPHGDSKQWIALVQD